MFVLKTLRTNIGYRLIILFRSSQMPLIYGFTKVFPCRRDRDKWRHNSPSLGPRYGHRGHGTVLDLLLARRKSIYIRHFPPVDRLNWSVRFLRGSYRICSVPVRHHRSREPSAYWLGFDAQSPRNDSTAMSINPPPTNSINRAQVQQWRTPVSPRDRVARFHWTITWRACHASTRRCILPRVVDYVGIGPLAVRCQVDWFVGGALINMTYYNHIPGTCVQLLSALIDAARDKITMWLNLILCM